LLRSTGRKLTRISFNLSFKFVLTIVYLRAS
jgi:hypothetical protein